MDIEKTEKLCKSVLCHKAAIKFGKMGDGQNELFIHVLFFEHNLLMTE